MAKLRVGVIFGGRSGEHEVSLVSARAVIAGLDRSKYEVIPIGITREGRWLVGRASLAPAQVINEGTDFLLAPQPRSLTKAVTGVPRLDVVLPILHGPFGEDGTIQGFLELAGIPYIGSGVLGSAVAMDKDVMKRLFQQAGLPTVPYQRVWRREWAAGQHRITTAIEKHLRYPVFVKPANLGSSVGISKVHGRAELGPALELAAQYDAKIVVEQGVEAREIECAVLGNDTPEASVPGEVIADREFYDYEAKYADTGSQTIVPAPIPTHIAKKIQQLALAAFAATECRGLARVDFFLGKTNSEVWVNEINSMPGFTPISMYPKLWKASGLPFPALLDRLIELALDHR